MPKQNINGAIINEIERQISLYSASESLVAVLKQQLTISTGGLFKNNPPVLLTLPIKVYQALTGRYKLALPATVALIYFRAAADIFDDLEDEDNPDSISSTIGKPIANNTATTFLIMAESTLSHQPRLHPSSKIKIIQCINHYYSLACLGQHMDISLHPGQLVSEVEFLNIAYLKSAVSVECAVRTGALLAEEKPKCLAYITKFGYYLGMACQLNNDIKGILDHSDLKKKKITLPWIFALNESGSTSRSILIEFLNSNCNTAELETIKKLLFSCGAIQYSLFKSASFKQLAIDSLEKAHLNKKSFNRLCSIL